MLISNVSEESDAFITFTTTKLPTIEYFHTAASYRYSILSKILRVKVESAMYYSTCIRLILFGNMSLFAFALKKNIESIVASMFI